MIKFEYDQLVLIVENIRSHKPRRMVNLFDPLIDHANTSLEVLEAKAFFSPAYMFSTDDGMLHTILPQ